ncbi:alkaline phosphatase family protein [bacterium]|nr:alkaline phosphatase family protein [bacterium]
MPAKSMFVLFPCVYLSLVFFVLCWAPGCAQLETDNSRPLEPVYIFADHYHEAIFARQNVTLDLDRIESHFFLMHGWSKPEWDDQRRSFVWSEQKDCAVLVPLMRPIDLSVFFEASPFEDVGLPPQVLTVKMNDQKIGIQVMAPGWQSYRFEVVAQHVQAGNNILTFQFSRLASPRELGLGPDIRKLTACFRGIGYMPSQQAACSDNNLPHDLSFIEERLVDNHATKTMVIPPTGSMSFRLILPDHCLLVTGLGLGRADTIWDVDLKEALLQKPIIFRIKQRGPTGDERTIFDRKFPQNKGDRELLQGHKLGQLLIVDQDYDPKQPRKIPLTFQGYYSSLTFETEREPVSTHCMLAAFFDEARILGSWSDRPFEQNIQTAEHTRAPVFLLGLDGLTWDLLLPMIERGELPNLASLIDQGFCSALQTILPSKSPMLWTSIATGKVPEKHGIVDYVSWDAVKKTRIPVTVNLRTTKALWNILGDLGKVSTVIGWWPSWPAESINGVMVSDRRGGPDVPRQTHPPELWTELQEHCPPEPFDYRLFLPAAPDLINRTMGDVALNVPEAQAIKDQLMRVQQNDSYFFRCARYLLDKRMPDLLALYLNGSDPVCHLFWKYLFPEQYGMSAEEAEPFAQIIPGYYRYLDSMVGQLRQQAGSDTTFIIVSDHGFGGEYNRFFKVEINRLMERLGLYALDEQTGQIDQTRTMVERGPSIDASLDQRMLFNPIMKNDPKRLAQITDQLARDLEAISSAQTGHTPFKFDGSAGPDYDFTIMVDYQPMLEEDLMIKNERVPFAEIFPEDFVSGSHGWGPDGIIIACGPHIKRQSLARLNFYEQRNNLFRKPTILDITPTILYLMGLPLGEDMDGQPCFDLITDEYHQRNPVTKIPSYDQVGTRLEYDRQAIESNQDQAIRDQLKSLGYIN